MIQTVLVLVIVGLAVAQVYVWLWPRTEEGFEYVKREIDPAAMRDGIYDPDDARATVLRRKVGGHGLDSAGLAELENPNPYHPSPDGREIPQSLAHTLLPATTYLNLVPGSQTDEYTEDDPLDLPWIASWSVADRYARRNQNCAVKYTEAGVDGTTIMTVSKSCESEMPHTRAGDRIAIPDTVLDAFKADIIAHELVHIYQKRFPQIWREFYQTQWGFESRAGPAPSMPASVTEARRSNPDTWLEPWTVWKGRWWPLAVYTNPKAPSLREATTIWWDDEDRRVLTRPPPGWTAFFGRPSQDEHPHEMSAVMIVASDTTSEAGRRLMSWWRSKTPIFKK